MEFYLIIVQNGETPSRAIHQKKTYDEALSAYHSELAYRAKGRTSTLCMIIDGRGNVLNCEKWTANEEE